jgi:hypothetical protein
MPLRVDALHPAKSFVNLLYWHKAMRTSRSFLYKASGKARALSKTEMISVLFAIREKLIPTYILGHERS